MNILIVGATGFIGNAIFHRLVSDHCVTIASRSPIEGYDRWVHVDFMKQNKWNEILEHIDLVIQTVGTIDGDFKQVQANAPIELFNACIKKKIKVINISAIGAEEMYPIIPFLQTKKKADEVLQAYDKAVIIYPGIVIGKGAISTQFFAEMAQLPIIPIIEGNGPPPTIHITQLTHIVKEVVENFEGSDKQIFAISKPESLETVLTAIKGKKPLFIKTPKFIFKYLFKIFPNATIGIFNKNMFEMLTAISASKYTPICDIASKYIVPTHLKQSNFFPQLLAIACLIFIWIWSGVSSLISWDQSYGMMQEIGASHTLSIAGIYVGCIVDILLGIGLIFKRYQKNVILLQTLFIIIYTLILTLFATHYWLHPFGVLSKNFSILALNLYVYKSLQNRN